MHVEEDQRVELSQRHYKRFDLIIWQIVLEFLRTWKSTSTDHSITNECFNTLQQICYTITYKKYKTNNNVMKKVNDHFVRPIWFNITVFVFILLLIPHGFNTKIDQHLKTNYTFNNTTALALFDDSCPYPCTLYGWMTNPPNFTKQIEYF
jgi:hypothetical protein